MAKAKTKAPASKFEAIVELKYGRGKKAQTVTVPVTVDFDTIYVSEWHTPSQALNDEAIDRAFDVEITNKVLNSKEMLAAYKAWDKAYDDDAED